jgi:hypothetical protein
MFSRTYIGKPIAIIFGFAIGAFIGIVLSCIVAVIGFFWAPASGLAMPIVLGASAIGTIWGTTIED